MNREPGRIIGSRGRVPWPVVAALFVAACGGTSGGRDPGAIDAVDAPDANVPIDAPDVPGDAFESRDLPGSDEAPDGAHDAPGDVPGELPGDLVPTDVPAPDLPTPDVPTPDALPDVPPPAPWENLVGTGETVGHIVGVASHMGTAVGDDPQRDFEFDQYVDFQGFKIRRGLRWSNVQPDRGVWNFDKVSAAVDGAVEHGVRLLPLLAYGNSWAQDDPEVYGTLHIEDYAAYAGGMAAQFCATVKDYEIWNEQNITRFWHLPPDPAKYADLLIASAAAIRAACPDARVVFGGMSSYDDVDLFNTWGFLRLALEARPAACEAFDALALHPYTWFQFDPPEHDEEVSIDVVKPSQTAMTTLARDIVAAAGCAPKPILFTEVGWPSYELAEEKVANYAARSLLLAARDGVEGWYWYTFWDDNPASGGIRPHENYFGLWAWPGADDSVRRPKPAWSAVKAAGMQLRGYRFARDLRASLGLPNDVYALVFLDDAGAIALALWDGREMPDVTLDAQEAGGPDTTFALDLPLPGCATGLHRFDQDGTPLEGPALAPTVPLVLAPRVQYLAIDCAGAGQ